MTSRYLLTFLLNSLWQIPLAAAVAAVACRVMRHGPAAYRHAVWVAALTCAVLLPLASARRSETIDRPHFDLAWAMPDEASAHPTVDAQVSAPAGTQPARHPRTISFTETAAAVLTGGYLLFLLLRLVSLVRGSIWTTRIRRNSQAAPIPKQLEIVWDRCRSAFDLTDVELLFSDRICGPANAGRAVILPEGMREERSEAMLTTAIGHEMAHIARRDFACNLLFEVLRLPISFHPASWLIRRGIEGAREMACDELVTGRLMDAGAYARSIMSIAAGMTTPPRLGHSLGVLDGDNLEERIRRLVEPQRASLKRARLVLLTGLAALVVMGVIASTLPLTARAQDGANDLMKQAGAAYDRGDYQEAIGQFENAVKLEPKNIKAKLFLAYALLQQKDVLKNPGGPAVSLARRQYLDVLALDPKNKAALQGMMLILVNSKEVEEGHALALKAIAADASDATTYYTAGFLDWELIYPDYMAARKAAGMKPADPGNIPDAALRANLRLQHGPQIEEGFRMLQIALQLDPGYSDAMAYMNLLYRIQAGIADTPEQAAEYVGQANNWVAQAIAAKRRAAAKAPEAPKTLDMDAPAPGPFAPAPPPPPPPPPPGATAKGEPLALQFQVASGVQAAK